MNVRVEADPAHPAGHALIRVPGAAGAAATPGFRIQRDAGWGDDKLGPGGWQGSDALLHPGHAEALGTDLVLHVGWEVCRHLETGVFEFSLPAAGLAQVGLFWPDIAPLHAGVSDAVPLPSRRVVVSDAKTAPAPVPLPPSAPRVAPPVASPGAPLSAPASRPLPPAAASPEPNILRGAIFAAALGMLLLLAGLGTYYWRNRDTAGVEATPLATASPPGTTAPAALNGLSVPDVLARAPDASAVRAEGERRLQTDQRDDGLLLLEAAADRADPGAAAALARLYDPVLFRPGGPIPRPDPRQAARYYREAARGGADVAAAREALQRHLQARVQSGDLGASLSLKDFWP